MDSILEMIRRCDACSDERLFAMLEEKTVGERENLVKILVVLGALDERRVAPERGSPSIYKYCTGHLGYCERTAYRRVAAARIGRKHPVILGRLRSGAVHLTAIATLAEHFTEGNVEALLKKAEGATSEQLKKLAAGMAPVGSAPPEKSRVIAVVSASEAVVGDMERSTAELSLEPGRAVNFRTEHTFTLTEAAEDKLRRVRELTAHRFPMGDIESIFEAALDALLEAVDPSRRASKAPSKPRAADEETRRIPEWVKRLVRARDEERCAFVSPQGARCGERRFLQFDHIVPWSLGGRSDDPANVRQLCGAHNRWAWRHAFVTRR